MRVVRKRRGNRVVVVGLLDDESIVFRVDLRRMTSTESLLGTDLNVPFVEISELEVMPDFQGGWKARRAICEALTEALILSDADRTHLIGAVAENDDLFDRLEARPEFRRLGQAPWPFVATVGDITDLRDLVCS